MLFLIKYVKTRSKDEIISWLVEWQKWNSNFLTAFYSHPHTNKKILGSELGLGIAFNLVIRYYHDTEAKIQYDTLLLNNNHVLHRIHSNSCLLFPITEKAKS